MKLAILPVTPFQQNCSLVVCTATNRAALVDPGGEVDRLLDAVAKSGATLEKILAVLRDDTAAPVFFHCGSGNRVGGALIPYFMLDKGMAEDDAVALAMRIGLRGADLLQWGVDYAHRHSRS